jgi:hypothetical protein
MSMARVALVVVFLAFVARAVLRSSEFREWHAKRRGVSGPN